MSKCRWTKLHFRCLATGGRISICWTVAWNTQIGVIHHRFYNIRSFALLYRAQCKTMSFKITEYYSWFCEKIGLNFATAQHQKISTNMFQGWGQIYPVAPPWMRFISSECSMWNHGILKFSSEKAMFRLVPLYQYHIMVKWYMRNWLIF